MNTSTIYARIPSELKDKIITLTRLSGKPQSDTLVDLINQGLLYTDSQKELKETQNQLNQKTEKNRSLENELERKNAELTIAQQKLDAAERARGHLQRVLNTEVGKCTVLNCDAPINLYSFAYQQCPNGHTRSIKLYNEYKKAPGVADVLVTGLAIIGGVALATELLNDNNPDLNQ